MDMPGAFATDEQSDVRALIKENASLREQLDKFVLEDKQVPDATIASGFKSLYDSLESWVEELLSQQEQRRQITDMWRRVQSAEESEGILHFLGLYESKPDISWRYEMDEKSRQRLNWLGTQTHCSSVILSLVIWRFLESKVFKESFPIGTVKDHKDYPGHQSLINDIFDAMNDEEEDQGASVISHLNTAAVC